ncbi:dTDP-4-amino-4,6-dideoxygalactose transaminase [Leucobacter komagatae]|uniref:dTDP-4-amino-4,6-dideoxygalactose transaminase n=1 Tax=Leucobacter komagatae TaxID=55969 RepID=A0A542Y6T0_9MICO|nr:DegT/DnrJ/EryC1/StrS family aminotransferase [Leucobacter komagatae]TQL43803.1 dTDP-4-amino-4,6-dideoxygalactose transaminase [Leucobacter komagatae]
MRLNVPDLGSEELASIAEVLESGYLTQGPKVAEFERLVAEHVGVEHAFATSSATTGIHLALRAAGVEPGDEVIVPDFSFPATANAVIQQGAIPVFVDINLATFNMNPALIESKITEKTAAIMPVHAFGLPADMDAINEIAARHNLPVIEDAACALGGTFKGREAGSLGTAGVFSFHPRKIITTGEGGLVSTQNAEMAERIAVLRTHGAVRGSHFMSFVEAGYNYRLSDVLGAIGVVQMGKLRDLVAKRQELAGVYNRLLAGVQGVQTPTVPAETTHTYQSYVVLLDAKYDRNAVIDAMRERGIETTLGTYSMHLQPYFSERFGIADEELPQATRAHSSALTLPLYPQLTEAEIASVCETLGEVLASQG